tara:strand:+ start:7480 stop:7692 length:213 start_codon:yes stop_codon:yes gene_type:complete
MYRIFNGKYPTYLGNSCASGGDFKEKVISFVLLVPFIFINKNHLLPPMHECFLIISVFVAILSYINEKLS